MILKASWDGLDIKYIYSQSSTSDALIMYVMNSDNLAVDFYDKNNQNPPKDCL